jgi:hypothetical protein
MQLRKIVIPFLAFLLFASPAFAQFASNFPQFPFGTWYSVDALATFLGVPSDWLAIPKVIYFVIVPFIVAITVTYGILTELNIFRTSLAKNKINIILSISLAFLLLPSGTLAYIVNYFYAAGEAIGLIAFGALFIVGTLLWAVGTFWRIRGTYQAPSSMARTIHQIENRINYHRREVRHLQDRIDRAAPGDPRISQWIAEQSQHQADIANLQAEQAHWHSELRKAVQA